MMEVQPVLGPVLTLAYMILVYFCLMNMFMSILAENYAIELRAGSADTDAMMDKIRKNLYRTLESTIPYFKRRRLADELEKSRLMEIKRGLIVEDHEVDALRYRYRELVFLVGPEIAAKEIKGYEDDLNREISAWIPRDRFSEIDDHLTNVILEHEQMMRKQSEDAVRELFFLVDEDGSGFIEPDEVDGLVDKLQIALNRNEKADLIDMINQDCDGSMGFAEFYQWYVNFNPTEKYTAKEEGDDDDGQDIKESKNPLSALELEEEEAQKPKDYSGRVDYLHERIEGFRTEGHEDDVARATSMELMPIAKGS